MLRHALESLRDLLGEKGYLDDADTMAPWLTDWRGRFTGKALAMLAPANVDEVAAIVAIAAQYRIALVPQGGNSGMVAGATPDRSGTALLLSLRRMNHIIEIDAQNSLVRCQAGVILQDLHDAVAAAGLRFPLTLGGKGSATIGGLIATNAGGTQVLRHGAMRNLVAGIEAVMPDGAIFDALAPLKKDNRGYDLKHLLIGSEGSLGVITAATLTLAPALIDRCVVWAGVADPADAYTLMQSIQSRSAAQLEGFEIIPATALDSVIQHIAGTRPPLIPPAPWNVLIELVKDRESQAEPSELAIEIMESALTSGLISDATIANNEAQAEAFWKLRDSISEAERARGPAVQHDISVPVADMARFIMAETSVVEAKFPGSTVIAFGHLGDGNVHFHVKAPTGVDSEIFYRDEAPAISAFVYNLVIQYHGSISAEHGIGQAKLDTLRQLDNRAHLAAVRAIKVALDPHNIMNPGKLVPLA